MADCNLCVAVVGNHTVPIRERRRIRVNAKLLLSSRCCKDFTASPELLKKNLTSYKVYALCSNHTSGKDSNDLDLLM